MPTYVVWVETKDGEKVPFYWRAQASAWLCVYKMWDKADPDGTKTLESELDVTLDWGRRVADRLRLESAPEHALHAWSELAPQLNALAELYFLDPVR